MASDSAILLPDVPDWMLEWQRRFPVGRTNYFRQTIPTGELRTWETERCRLFTVREPDGFARLYFHAASAADLGSILSGIAVCEPLVVAILCKQPMPDVHEIFEQSGFRWYDEYKRMMCRPLPPLDPDPLTEFASRPEALLIRAAMVSDFDPITSHFPNVAEFADWSERRWIPVRRNESKVTGYAVLRVLGRHAVFNYFKNDSAHPRDALLLIRQLQGELVRQGADSAELWVRHDNEKVIKLYQFFGWKFDGLSAQYLIRPPLQERNDS